MSIDTFTIEMMILLLIWSFGWWRRIIVPLMVAAIYWYINFGVKL